jgi:hypothetical protein
MAATKPWRFDRKKVMMRIDVKVVSVNAVPDLALNKMGGVFTF